ncbi:hypothetical protein [Variovorax paradoxus]|uniref:hypothetical protein n=1 Tax=Variovorax paradoxus TaxID=34073 RepID=UPI0028637FD4|nr:hypothetical protein [Variovorax paradoxus]MDR6453926.1 hypothetical protein [Variovorax paradoxus]
MSDLLAVIVREDEKISAVLEQPRANRLAQLREVVRLSIDREALVLTILSRLLLEHDGRKLAERRELKS